VLLDGCILAAVGAALALVSSAGAVVDVWEERYPIVGLYAMPRPRHAPCAVVVSARRVSIVRVQQGIKRALDVDHFCTAAVSSSCMSENGTVLLCGGENGTITCYTLCDMI
jgi:hypothetical protein